MEISPTNIFVNNIETTLLILGFVYSFKKGEF